MNMDDHINCSPISVEGMERIDNIIFDGCHYYFVISCEQRIVKADLCFHIVSSYHTCRQYECICYDWKEHCFWASSSASCNHVYKLDCEMKELKCVELRGCGDPHGAITGLSFDCCDNALVIAFECTIVTMDKATGRCERYCWIRNGRITGILYLCPGCIILVQKNDGQHIYVVNPNGEISETCCDECETEITAMFFNPCEELCDLDRVECLTDKCGCDYLCSVPFCQFQLRFAPCRCNYEICENCCSTPGPKPEPSGCNDILESIALVEAAISHILNAEGEKLQKIIAITDDFDKIMCVNREVNETIMNVTSLEQILYSKLVAATKICARDDQSDCGCRS